MIETHEGLDQLDRDLVALEQTPDAAEVLGQVFRTIHTIKGSSGFLALDKLGAIAHAGENLLSLIRDGKRHMTGAVTSALLAMADAIRQVLERLEEEQGEGDGDYSELVATLAALAEQPREPAEAEAPAACAGESSAASARAATASGSSVAGNTIRVDVTLLDTLMNLVGALVLSRNQILQYTATQQDPALLGSCQRLNLVTTELQEGVMKTRMQPIGSIWSKLPRVVRDLAVSCGKSARIEMEGRDTELDKTIIESIKDPLTHAIRNAVDHGIEGPEGRRAAGKPAEGCVRLRAEPGLAVRAAQVGAERVAQRVRAQPRRQGHRLTGLRIDEGEALRRGHPQRTVGALREAAHEAIVCGALHRGRAPVDRVDAVQPVGREGPHADRVDRAGVQAQHRTAEALHGYGTKAVGVGVVAHQGLAEGAEPHRPLGVGGEHARPRIDLLARPVDRDLVQVVVRVDAPGLRDARQPDRTVVRLQPRARSLDAALFAQALPGRAAAVPDSFRARGDPEIAAAVHAEALDARSLLVAGGPRWTERGPAVVGRFQQRAEHAGEDRVAAGQFREGDDRLLAIQLGDQQVVDAWDHAGAADAALGGDPQQALAVTLQRVDALVGGWRTVEEHAHRHQAAVVQREAPHPGVAREPEGAGAVGDEGHRLQFVPCVHRAPGLWRVLGGDLHGLLCHGEDLALGAHDATDPRRRAGHGAPARRSLAGGGLPQAGAVPRPDPAAEGRDAVGRSDVVGQRRRDRRAVDSAPDQPGRGSDPGRAHAVHGDLPGAVRAFVGERQRFVGPRQDEPELRGAADPQRAVRSRGEVAKGARPALVLALPGELEDAVGVVPLDAVLERAPQTVVDVLDESDHPPGLGERREWRDFERELLGEQGCRLGKCERSRKDEAMAQDTRSALGRGTLSRGGDGVLLEPGMGHQSIALGCSP
ncbi:MAG: Hpt domain-containing protein [Planctomycetes bacterium]|nr:Hpt domain-containing protein [Planctomycetota bacterium]